MKIIILILFILNSTAFGQNKIDTVHNINAVHNYEKINTKENYLNLVLKCKEKADKLISEHFDYNFFKEKIVLDTSNCELYWKNNTRIQLFDNLDKKPAKIKLAYSIIFADSIENSNIEVNVSSFEVNIKCTDKISIISSTGIPNEKNYIINIDYDKALEIAKKKGFINKKNKKKNKAVDITLPDDKIEIFFKFTDEKKYVWIFSKEIKRKKKERVLSCSSMEIITKNLYIDAKTGKTKIRKGKHYIHIKWY